MPKELKSADEVILALGGPRAVMELLSAKPTAFCNWRAAKSFPAKHLAIMSRQLEERGFSAPASLWRQSG